MVEKFLQNHQIVAMHEFHAREFSGADFLGPSGSCIRDENAGMDNAGKAVLRSSE
jgi:hypothetical protein